MKHSPLLIALGVVLAFPHNLHAAISSMTVQDNENGDYLTLVSQNGTLLDAINLGHPGPNLVVNGIAFVSTPGTTPAGTNWDATGAATNDGLANPGIDDLFFSELTSPGSTTLNYNNLDPTHSYLVQILHGEPRDCCATTYSSNTLDTEIDRAETIPPIMVGNGVNGENPPATSDVAIVTVQISGVSSFTYIARSSPGRQSGIAGFQVRDLGGTPPGPTGSVPFISEFVAVRNDSYQDEDNDTPDWIEIYNPTGGDLDLNGYYLTDNAANLTKWRFPSTLLQDASYLVVFASNKDRDTSGSELHSNFRLSSAGEYLALVAPDGTTVVSEFSPTYPVQEAGFSHGVGGLAPGGPTGYFATATPGSTNGILIAAPLIAPTITPDCGTFTTSTQATITSNFPGGQIRYTTNGSAPTSSSTIYSGPINIFSTTHLRARVIDPGNGTSGEIASVHFAKLSTSSSGGLGAPSTFTSDLPIIVVENFGAGGIPSPGSNYQTARLAVHEIDPDTGRSSLANPPDACFRIGIRKRGQSSSGFSKPQYRVELRDDNDVDTDYPLLGLPEESDWVFNGPWTDKALIRNPLAFELGRTIGIQAPRTKHFEMFLSTNGGTLAASEYVGVYVLLEKIKDGRNRTDLENLDPADSAEPEITGGYLFRFEPPGIANDGPRATNWSSVEITEPKVPTTAQRNWLGNYLDQFVSTLGWSRGSGANNSGVPNPDPLTGYPAFIDVDSFVSLWIVNELLRDQDSYIRSDYMYKDRLDKLHKGPLWDYNLTAGTGCCFDNRNTAGWQYQHDYNRGGRDHGYEPDWFVPLMRCPDFRQRVIDRWFELRTTGVLELSNLFALIDSLADPLAESAVRNFTKWDTLDDGSVGFPTPATNTWDEQILFMKDWLTQRTAWIDGQFSNLVTIAPSSQAVSPGAQVALNAVGGPIYYTLDGSDPRLSGGGLNPTALTPGGGGNPPVTFISSAANNVSALRPSSSSPGATAWTAVNYTPIGWQSGSNGIGYENSASNYAALLQIDVGNSAGNRPHSVYVRYPFNVTDPAAFTSLTLRMKYDDGFVAYLNGNRIESANAPGGTPAWNQSATGDHPDGSAVLFVDFDVSADVDKLVAGPNVLAIHILNNGGSSNATNTGCSSSDMLLIAELVGADVSPGGGLVTINTTVEVTARTFDGSNWSAPTSETYVVGTPAHAGNLAVSELNYHPSNPTAAEVLADPTYRDDDFEFIELKNISAGPIDLSGASFVEGISFTIPAPTVLPAGSYALLVENLAAFEERYGTGLPVIGVYANKFKNDGDTVRMIALGGTDIFHFTFNDIWFRPTDGDGYTLVTADEPSLPNDYSDPASWGISYQLLGNPGATNGTVLSQSFAGWKHYYFTPAEIADPLLSGPNSDLDSDGIETLLEFALGLNPKVRSTGGLPTASRITTGPNDYLALSFRRHQNALDLSYRVEVSGDLITWSESTILVGAPSDNGDGTDLVTIRDSVPLSSSNRRFIRLSVTEQ